MKNLIILLISITGFIITALITPSNEYAFAWFIILLGFTISTLISLAAVITAYLRKKDSIEIYEENIIIDNYCPICDKNFGNIYDICDECGHNPYSV